VPVNRSTDKKILYGHVHNKIFLSNTEQNHISHKIAEIGSHHINENKSDAK
jgi:hypothetical protein